MAGEQPPLLNFKYDNPPMAAAPGTGAVFAQLQGHPQFPLALRREFYAGGHTGIHRHQDFLALYAVRGGQGVHLIDGHPYGIARGDVYLMPAGATHGYADHNQLEIDAFYFKIDLLSEAEMEALRELPGFWNLFANDGKSEHRLHLTPERWQQLEAMIQELRGEWDWRLKASPLLLRSVFFRLLVWLARSIEDGGLPASKEKIDRNIALALQFCEAHFPEPLTVPQLASRAFLSPGHFSELFSRQLGMPPATYLRRLRLEKARELLRETDMAAGQIALETGFGDAAHFSRVFRAVYGVAPSAYREAERK